MSVNKRKEEIVEAVSLHVISAASVVTKKKPEEIDLEGSISKIVGGDIEKAKLILYLTEDEFNMNLPVDEEEFLKEFNSLEDFVSFFAMALFEREGLE